ncbi:MAG TPA: hypothetical protein VFM16_08020 [Holophagaceae bacterium]|nr:hypothetical protein [Holophagaceae bacterium]
MKSALLGLGLALPERGDSKDQAKGPEVVTCDFKVVDAQTGELRLAVYHRAISGTALSTIRDRFVRWCDAFEGFLKVKSLI